MEWEVTEYFEKVLQHLWALRKLSTSYYVGEVDDLLVAISRANSLQDRIPLLRKAEQLVLNYEKSL